MLTWRAMTAADLPGVMALADAIHPDLPESEAVVAERLALYPAGCRVLALDRAATGAAAPDPVAGYALAFPWSGAAPPKLDRLLGTLPAAPDRFYIHDVAVAPDMRGAGHADRIVTALIDHSANRRLDSACLVSVYGTGRFWARFGFVDATHDVPRDALAPYGSTARFMVRSLTDAAAARF